MEEVYVLGGGGGSSGNSFLELADQTNFKDEKESSVMLITISHGKSTQLANYS